MSYEYDLGDWWDQLGPGLIQSGSTGVVSRQIKSYNVWYVKTLIWSLQLQSLPFVLIKIFKNMFDICDWHRRPMTSLVKQNYLTLGSLSSNSLVVHSSPSRISPELCSLFLLFWPFQYKCHCIWTVQAAGCRPCLFWYKNTAFSQDIRGRPPLELQCLLTSRSVCCPVYLLSPKVYAPSWPSKT